MTASDTFTAFVDVLTQVLDDHDADAAELAGRLHLSRFHLDRIVSQVAGEPPRRFRRRVLLERAAYRLISTERSIHDVAVEAGYGSHEAFTRAFATAYGEPPTAWRKRPRTIRIEAPSGVHFHPPGSILLPSRDKVTAMDAFGGMIAHVLTFAAHRRTLAVLTLDKYGVTALGWGDPMRWVAEPAS